jgi:hypothetical protein
MQKKIILIAIVAVVAAIAGAVLLAMLSLSSGSSASFDPSNATYSLYGDTFTLKDGQIQIMGHSGMGGSVDTTTIPMDYTLATSSAGDLMGDGSQGDAVVLYRGFGANLEWLALFGFQKSGAGYSQIASSTIYMQDAAVQSISAANGVVTVNLLVVSAADQNLPHYEQTPKAPLTLRFKIVGNRFVAQ